MIVCGPTFACGESRNTARLPASSSSDDQTTDDKSTTVTPDVDVDDLDDFDDSDFDFEAAFQSRLAQEGGRTGVELKAAQRSVQRATQSATDNVKQSANSVKQSANSNLLNKDLGLLPTSEWGLSVAALGLVVLLAVGTHFASPAPFETTSYGEQLGFGGR